MHRPAFLALKGKTFFNNFRRNNFSASFLFKASKLTSEQLTSITFAVNALKNLLSKIFARTKINRSFLKRALSLSFHSLEPPVWTVKPNEMYQQQVNSELHVSCAGKGTPKPTVSFRRVSNDAE